LPISHAFRYLNAFIIFSQRGLAHAFIKFSFFLFLLYDAFIMFFFSPIWVVIDAFLQFFLASIYLHASLLLFLPLIILCVCLISFLIYVKQYAFSFYPIFYEPI
jgi:hypothetical protein